MNKTNKDKQHGMTLIEIMIALLLGSILLAGIIQVFTNANRTYRMQENTSRLQENGRFALDFISRDIRMADYWGCLKSGVNIANNLNPGSDFDDFKTSGLEGADNDNGGNDGDADNDENSNDIWDGTDTISLKGMSPSSIYIYGVPANTSADLKVTNGSGLLENDIIFVSDCAAADILQITNLNSNAGNFDNAVHNTGGLPSVGDPDFPGNAEKELEKLYGTDAQIYLPSSYTYFIGDSNGVPSLFRNDLIGAGSVALVEGIEDMQILYGEDPDGDKTPNYYVASSSVATWENVVSVKVSFLVTSLDDNLTKRPVAYTYNGITTTPTDNRLRRVFSATIGIRNRLE